MTTNIPLTCENPRVSIIIPVKEFNPYLRECLEALKKIDYRNHEIIVLPDHEPEAEHEGLRIIPTGEMGPSKKRDIGVNIAEGELIAFLDDDTWPAEKWLSKAVGSFSEGSIAAIGGPAVTPDDDSTLQKASGAVFTSRLGGGSARLRYMPLEPREVDDFPSCNLIVNRGDFIEAGGFNSCFWPGEDTEFCLRLVKDLGKKIMYDPEVLVYHHRRSLFWPHIKQVYAYALHRGYFVKRFPQNSRRLAYFVPSVLVVGTILLLASSLIVPMLRIPALILLGVYALACLADGLLRNPIKVGLLAGLGIIATHYTYGVGFIKGLFAKRLREEEC